MFKKKLIPTKTINSSWKKKKKKLINFKNSALNVDN